MNLAQAIFAAAQAPARARADRYMARIEARLGSLPDTEAQRKFLAVELEKWRERYTAWAARVDAGTATDPDLALSAFDFQLTMAAVSRRLADVPARVPVDAATVD